MCGIIGYVGKKEAMPVLLDGLRRLEYRGYDSAGIAVLNQKKHTIKSIKSVGKIDKLEEKIGGSKFFGNTGIAHTRWATHGKPSAKNSHPHSDCTGSLQIVHNGIIENYQELKEKLIKEGHKFKSETDSEVIAHLIEEYYQKDLATAIKKVLKLIKGAYGIVVIHKDLPEKIIAARKGSPLIIGVGKHETIVASDASAIVRYTKQVIYLDDGELIEISPNNFEIFNVNNKKITKKVKEIDWEIDKIEKGGYAHFMLKEIFEQPSSVSDTMRGRLVKESGNVRLGGLRSIEDRLRKIEKLSIVACGTAYTSALVGKYMIEEYVGIPVEVDYAHEFRYRKTIIDEKTAVLAISQSGETADTLAAVRESNEKGALTIGIINTVGSTIAREVEAGVYNHAGPEISVASTKAYTSQIIVLAMLTVFMGRQRKMSYVMGKRIIEELEEIPKKIKEILKFSNKIEKIAKKYSKFNSFAFLGKKYNYPLAFEGAIKLKEISYIHAEGFAAGEMKHGPIAMIDENFPSVFIAPKDSVYEKNISSIEELKARKGKVIAITTRGNKKIEKTVDDVIYIPKTLEMLSPLLTVIPLQLIAYYAGTSKGFDVDKPRNLAKSVTVE
jgi:glucosamine--fructose-6-phosphate aminotransferase (isomerizing)